MSDEYTRYGHMVQSAIAFNPDKKLLEPKHLRVGIDMSKADMKGLVTLLIEKGVFTKEEYLDAITQSAKEEVEFQKKTLAQSLGVDVNRIDLG